MSAIAALALSLALGTAAAVATPAAASGPARPAQAATVVRPAYPASATRAGIAGCALLDFDVEPDGTPVRIRVIRSLPAPAFGASAGKALAHWRFPPTATKAPETGKTELFLFNPAASGFAYSGPDCGSRAGTPVLMSISPPAPKPKAKPQPPAPPPRPANLPDRVDLHITRPPVVQTFAAAYGSNAHPPAGRVTLRFCVNEQGQTEHIQVVKAVHGNLFTQTALTYIRAAVFKPHMIQGFPVTACDISQTIIFRPAKR